MKIYTMKYNDLIYIRTICIDNLIWLQADHIDYYSVYSQFIKKQSWDSPKYVKFDPSGQILKFFKNFSYTIYKDIPIKINPW